MAMHIDRAVRREEILDITDKMVRQGGASALQMREVAQRAELASGTLYNYFPTKEVLFAALYACRLSEMFAEVSGWTYISDQIDPRAFFIQFANMYRDMHGDFGRELDISGYVTTESVLDVTAVEELARVTSAMVDVMRSALVGFDVEKPELVVTVLWSLLSGLAAHFSGPRSTFHHLAWDHAVEFAADRVLGAFLPKSSSLQ